MCGCARGAGGAAAELMAATNYHAPTHCTAVDQHDLGTIVEMVSQKTVDVNTETYSGDTALTMVAWWGERAVLKLLINAGASVSRETSYVGGVAACLVAVVLTLASTVNLLRRGATALSEAARGGHLDCARVLVAAGVDITDLSSMNETIINRLLSDWSTELSDSEHAKRHEVLDWLIKGGVDIHNETECVQHPSSFVVVPFCLTMHTTSFPLHTATAAARSPRRQQPTWQKWWTSSSAVAPA